MSGAGECKSGVLDLGIEVLYLNPSYFVLTFLVRMSRLHCSLFRSYKRKLGQNGPLKGCVACANALREASQAVTI